MPEKRETLEEISKQIEELSKNAVPWGEYRAANEFVIDVARSVLFGPEEKRPRKRKETVMTGAERQKLFRERRRAEGHRRIISWVEDEKQDSAYKSIKIKIHTSSLGICKRERHLKEFLATCLKLAEEGSAEGYFPEDVCQDIFQLFKVLGLNEQPDSVSTSHPSGSLE